MTEYLKKALNRATCEEFLKAELFVTKETIQSRVLLKVKQMLQVIIGNENHSEGLIYVHPEISAFLNKHFPYNCPTLDKEERFLVWRIYSADYHDSETLRSFCDLLETTVAPERKWAVYLAFAVDGFRGQSLADYVENLRFPISSCNEDDESLAKHVSAVRELYDKFRSASVETVAIVLRNAMNFVESSDPLIRNMTNHYLSNTIDRFGDIKHHFNTLKKSDDV